MIKEEINISEKEWELVLQNNDVIKPKDKELLKLILNYSWVYDLP